MIGWRPLVLFLMGGLDVFCMIKCRKREYALAHLVLAILLFGMGIIYAVQGR